MSYGHQQYQYPLYLIPSYSKASCVQQLLSLHHSQPTFFEIYFEFEKKKTLNTKLLIVMIPKYR